MITAPMILETISEETKKNGSVYPIPFQKIFDLIKIKQDSTDHLLLMSILDVLTQQGKLKMINGNPPFYIQL